MSSGNIPLGTYVSDGVRTGPFYTGQLPSNFIADANGVLTSSSHSTYGPGVLCSPQNTYAMIPYPTSAVNVVAQTVNGQIAGAGNLTLTGNAAATVFNGTYVQFDYPRVVSVTISGANATAGTRVTIFGTDWYGMPLQHTYVVANQQVYPLITLAVVGPVFAAATIVPALVKAFYTVNRVYIDQALPAGSLISLGAMGVFGLPYRVNDFGDVIAIGWDTSSDMTSPVTATAPGAVTTSALKLQSLGLFVPADATPTSVLPAGGAVNGDVRGLYMPSTIAGANSIKKLRFTSYIPGMDVWQNQLAAMGKPQGAGFVPPLTPAALYGNNQYYTGNPS